MITNEAFVSRCGFSPWTEMVTSDERRAEHGSLLHLSSLTSAAGSGTLVRYLSAR
jgi:hypothetical protein